MKKITTINCKNCGEKLENVSGKRQKEFCNGTCRSNYWQKQARIKKKGAPKKNYTKNIGMMMPLKESIPIKEPILSFDASKVDVKDLTKPTNQVKPITDPPAKTNKSVNTARKPFMSQAIRKKMGFPE